MKPFSVETPVLTAWKGHGRFYRLGMQPMLCRWTLGKMFEIGNHRKISLRLSSRPSSQSVAIRFYNGKHCPFWHKEKRTFNDFIQRANEWLMKNPPLRDMAIGDTITVHVTVYLHED